jgi:hypothetical protein
MMDLQDIERVRDDLRFRGAQGTTGKPLPTLLQAYPPTRFSFWATKNLEHSLIQMQ